MYIKIIDAYRTIVAIADKNLIGKKFFEDNKQLDIKESFYKGELKTKEEIKEEILFWLKEDATFNIVGENSIKAGLEAGALNEESIKTIANIPYALILL